MKRKIVRECVKIVKFIKRIKIWEVLKLFRVVLGFCDWENLKLKWCGGICK